MSKPIDIRIDDKEVSAALAELLDRTNRLRPAFLQIGETLKEQVNQRFATETDWEGNRWAPNRPVTLELYMRAKGIGQAQTGKDKTPKAHRDGSAKRKGLDKDGRITPATAEMLMRKKVLQGLTGQLRQQHGYGASHDQVVIFSTMQYAATQQFGAARGAFGRTRRGAPIPYGRIPPRPFLPLTANGQLPPAAQSLVLNLLHEHLSGGWR